MKNPVTQFLLWSVFLSHPVFAQEAIQIEIDSAPVEIEIQKPVTPAQEEAPPETTAKTEPPEDEEKPEKASKGYGVALGIGALVAGVLAALGGGGGGGGGGSAVTH